MLGFLSRAIERSSSVEERLIARCKEGDLTAFDEIVAAYQDKIFNLCRWNLGDADLAADAAQDVFVRAWRAIGRFRGESSLSTWLHRIALNVISDTAKKRARGPMSFSSLDTNDEDAAEFDAPDTAPSPEASATRHARQDAVQNALRSLPEHHRAVLVLFDVQGHSYEDVSAILQLPMGTVKSRLNRARAALRAELETCRELFED